MFRSGHYVFPVGLICTLIDTIFPFYRQSVIATTTMSQYYRDDSLVTNFINQEVKSEIMATYIRYIAEPAELYGILPFDKSIMNRFIFRYQIYCFIIKVLFSLRPSCYFTIQRAYLHKFIPCHFALKANVPVVMLGSSDQTLFKASLDNVPLHWDEIDFKSSSYYDQITPDLLTDMENQLNNRISNRIIDSSIWYMKVNPYKGQSYEPSDYDFNTGQFNIYTGTDLMNKYGGKRPFVCIYMHEFSDYHNNGTMASFATSYFDWLVSILSIVISHNIDYVIKLHPAILNNPNNDKYASSLAAFKLLPEYFDAQINITLNPTTLDLINAGLSLGCTMKGTVATELAYLRIPVVCSGIPPYKSALPQRVVNDLESIASVLINYANPEPITDLEHSDTLRYLVFKELYKNSASSSFSSSELVKKYSINLSPLFSDTSS